MSKLRTEYIFVVVFMALAIYQLVIPNYLELVLYTLAGTAFLIMGLLKDGKFTKYKKAADYISWTLIILTALYFLFMLRNDSNL